MQAESLLYYPVAIVCGTVEQAFSLQYHYCNIGSAA